MGKFIKKTILENGIEKVIYEVGKNGVKLDDGVIRVRRGTEYYNRKTYKERQSPPTNTQAKKGNERVKIQQEKERILEKIQKQSDDEVMSLMYQVFENLPKTLTWTGFLAGLSDKKQVRENFKKAGVYLPNGLGKDILRLRSKILSI